MHQIRFDSRMLMQERAGRALIIAPAQGRHAMNDIVGRIEELEVKAAESELIADLTTDWEIRVYNARLAKDLRAAAKSLRRRAKIVGDKHIF